jgi:hypothetical protein
MIRVLDSSGEVTFMPAEGWLPKENTAPHPPGPIPSALTAGSTVNFGSVIRTGAAGRLKVSLPEDHTLEAGANTEFLIERFARRSRFGDSGLQFRIKLYKGLIRWKLMNLEQRKSCVLGLCNYEVITPQFAMTVRGTEVELFSGPDMAGYVKLYSGSVSLVPHDTDKEIMLKPGEMLTIQGNGSISAPFRIPGGQ